MPDGSHHSSKPPARVVGSFDAFLRRWRALEALHAIPRAGIRLVADGVQLDGRVFDVSVFHARAADRVWRASGRSRRVVPHSRPLEALALDIIAT